MQHSTTEVTETGEGGGLAHWEMEKPCGNRGEGKDKNLDGEETKLTQLLISPGCRPVCPEASAAAPAGCL